MNRKEYLLECLSEECDEVSQRISKALRFSLEEIQPGQPLNNAERIVEELHDLFSVVSILNEEAIISFDLPSEEIVEAKKAKIEKFMEISRKQGVLKE